MHVDMTVCVSVVYCLSRFSRAVGDDIVRMHIQLSVICL